MRLFTDARIDAEANNEDADVDRGLEEDEDNFSSNIVVPALQEVLTYTPPRVGSSQVRTQRGRDHLQERWTKESQRGKMRIIPASGRSTHIALHTFNGDGTYQYHEMPSGATPVPINSRTGKRTMNDWKFFYDGWDHPDPNKSNTRSDTHNNLFPPDRYVLLYPDMLRKLGINKTQMTSKDALFWQLLFPIASPGQNGIDDDPHMPFYEPLARFTDTYVMINRVRGSPKDTRGLPLTRTGEHTLG